MHGAQAAGLAQGASSQLPPLLLQAPGLPPGAALQAASDDVRRKEAEPPRAGGGACQARVAAAHLAPARLPFLQLSKVCSPHVIAAATAATPAAGAAVAVGAARAGGRGGGGACSRAGGTSRAGCCERQPQACACRQAGMPPLHAAEAAQGGNATQQAWGGPRGTTKCMLAREGGTA